MSELDDLLAAARRAEPDPLSDEAADAVVREARRASDGPPSALDALVADARRADIGPLSDHEVSRVAERAAMTGRARHRRWTRRRVMMASGVAAALAAAVVTLALLPRANEQPVHRAEAVPTEAPVTAGEPTDLELSTGDHIVAAAGARYHVELPHPTSRRVRLDSGSVLFDVRPIEGGRFTVSTPNATVVVLGTVFTVRASERGTTVRVYEGSVEVEGEGRDATHVVNRGGVVHLGEGDAVDDPLKEAGEEAARVRFARLRHRATTVAVEPAMAEPRLEAPPETRRETVETPPTAADVRTWIASGNGRRALAAAREATGRGDVDPFRMLEGDALRSLGRLEEAADAYLRAAGELPPPRRQQAGFLEARLRAGELDDPAGALRALHQAGVTAADSPLRERAMALEAQLHHRLGHDAELRALAASYLEDYPSGSRAEVMRSYLE